VGGTGPSCVPRCGGGLLVGAAMIGTLILLMSAGGIAIALSKLEPARDILADREPGVVGGGGPGGGGNAIFGAQ
jgi:hypothetical protein